MPPCQDRAAPICTLNVATTPNYHDGLVPCPGAHVNIIRVAAFTHDRASPGPGLSDANADSTTVVSVLSQPARDTGIAIAAILLRAAIQRRTDREAESPSSRHRDGHCLNEEARSAPAEDRAEPRPSFGRAVPSVGGT